ncbi:phosphinothricin N-acetyltransferase [Klebsiella michiganensis]|nr:phosphinothricin N-acetyltransferase [Klebsiella michiganensis]
MLAIIGDGHSNAGSIAIHKKFGFSVAGQLRSVGYKDGRLAGYLDYAAPARRWRLDAAGVTPRLALRLAGLRYSAIL